MSTLDVTPATMSSAYQRMLNALDLHIAALEAEVDEVYEEYGLVPSDNQFFLYVSSNEGIIQLHEDAAFVCEAIMVVGPANNGAAAAGAVLATDTLTLSIQQMGPKHRITFSRNKAPNFTDMALLDNGGVSPEAFVPVSNTNGEQPPYTNAEYFYRLPVEWLIPRGDSVQTLFAREDLLGIDVNGTESTRYNAVPHVVLIGYKHF